MYGPQAKNVLYIFKQLGGKNNKEEYATETKCGLQNLNYLLSVPL